MKFLKDVGPSYGYHPVLLRSKFKERRRRVEFSFLAPDSFVSSGECKSTDESNVKKGEI